MIQLRRLLVATDFSESATHAVRYAVELARTFSAQLFIAHVLEEDLVRALPALRPFIDTASLDLGRYHEEIRRGALRALEDLAMRHNGGGVAIETVLLEGGGKAAEEIVRAARERRAELIVIATHGRGALRSALIGSTAEKVVRTASCPVLTIKSGGVHFV